MIVFWITSALLLSLALFIVLFPLVKQRRKTAIVPRKELNISIHKEHLQELKNDLQAGKIGQKEFDTAVQELEHDLIQDVTINEKTEETELLKPSTLTIAVIAILMPVFVIGLYLKLGDIDVIKNVQDQNPHQAVNGEMHSIDDMVEKLRSRLQTQPDDINGWKMLGRTYMVLNRYNDAAMAYGKVHELGDEDPGFLSDYAEALIMANDSKFTDKSLEMLSLALKKNPDQKKALWISGFAALDKGNNSEALQYWEHLLPLLTPGEEQANILQQHVNQLRQEMGLPVTAESTVAQADQNTSSMPGQQPAASVNVDVSLDSNIADKAGPDDTLFIFAKAAQGPPMPLAIIRKQVRDLPLKATLDDSMAMSPAMKLSSFNEIIIGARVSKSGNAMPQSGDLQGLSKTVSRNDISGAVKIIINQVVP